VALIVEDGTGKVDAESYESVANYRAYHAKFGNDVTAELDADIEIRLRKATDYMVTTFRGYWKKMRTVYNQALDWPRYLVERDANNFIGSNEVPVEVKAACCVLAYVVKTTPLVPTSIGRGKKSVKIGPLAVEFDGSGDSAPAFIGAVGRLAPLLTAAASGNTVGLVRC
jgi:hypothetical protein